MKLKIIIDKNLEEEIIVKVHSASELTEKIENIVLSYAGSDEISVQGDYEILKLKFSDIECVSVIDRKLYVFGKDGGKYRTGGTLSELEEKLPSYFVRINKSCIANGREIARFNTTFNGGVDAIFKSGNKDYVSRRCFADIKRRFKV